MAKASDGPASRYTREQVLEWARRHYEGGETLCSMAREAGVSGGYLTKMVKQAKADGWLRVRVESDLSGHQAATEALLQRPGGQVAMLVDGDTISFSVNVVAAVEGQWQLSLHGRTLLVQLQK